MPSVDQTLQYQNNHVEIVYEQDCGTYEVTFANADVAGTDVNLFLTAEAAGGSGGPNNKQYPQKMTLASTDPNHIGQYNTIMTVK